MIKKSGRRFEFGRLPVAISKSIDWRSHLTSATLARPAFERSHVRTATSQHSIVLTPYRVVTFFLLASILWKLPWIPGVFSTYLETRLNDAFFPPLLSSPSTLAVLFLTPLILGVVALFLKNRIALKVQAITTLICMFGLCIHQGTYNDATFVTCLWVSAWCVWYTFRMNEPAEILLSKARVFALLIISLVFLGGAAGKWTPGYWSGEVLYGIYFVDRDFWFFNLLRANLTTDSLREFATCYSRMVIMLETGCAFLWLLNPKIGSAIALTMFLGITLFSNVLLFSVMFCLIGLAIVGLHEPKRNAPQPESLTD